MFVVFAEILLVLVVFSLLMFWFNLSTRVDNIERRVFDKSKIKYTDGDNT